MSGNATKFINFYNNLAHTYNDLAAESLWNLEIRESFGFNTKGLKAVAKTSYYSARAHTVTSILQSMGYDE